MTRDRAAAFPLGLPEILAEDEQEGIGDYLTAFDSEDCECW